MNRQLEEARSGGAIGSSLQAEVTIEASANELKTFEWFGDDLKFLFIVSKVMLASREGQVNATVKPSTAQKCERCWHYRDDVGHDPAHPTICGRCTSNLFGAGETRKAA